MFFSFCYPWYSEYPSMAFCFKSVDFLFICCCQGPSFATIYGCWKYACSNDFQLCLPCPFQIFSIFLSCRAAMAVLLLISFEYFPFPSILDPRYSKFSKHSTVSLSLLYNFFKVWECACHPKSIGSVCVSAHDFSLKRFYDKKDSSFNLYSSFQRLGWLV